MFEIGCFIASNSVFCMFEIGCFIASNSVFCMFPRNHKMDPMVLEREAYILQAFNSEINQVPVSVVESWNFANPDEILMVLTSVVSKVFQLPGQGAKRGSPEWVAAVFRRDTYTFVDLIHHKKLMNKYLRKFRDELPHNGELFLLAGEKVPDRDYARSRTYEYLNSGQSKIFKIVCFACLKSGVLHV